MDDELRSAVMIWMMTRDRDGYLTRCLCHQGHSVLPIMDMLLEELTTETEASV